MTTYIVLAFFWVGNVDGQDLSVRAEHKAMIQERCQSMHPEAFLTEWHAGVRKYKFVWDNEVFTQKFWPGTNYICVLENGGNPTPSR